MAIDIKLDPTFRNYKAEQARNYAAHRDAYPEQLIKIIIEAHTSSGGGTSSLLDVGCGPGTATQQLAPYFDNVLAVDPSQGMVETARETPMHNKSGGAVRVEMCSAEEIDKFAEPNSVDLITVATAVHWFNLPVFYSLATKVLRPGGSIITWAAGDYFVDDDTPNAEEVRRVYKETESVIEPFELAGNRHARQLYANLALPWTVETDDASIQEDMKLFDQEKSGRTVFNPDGQPDDRFEGGYLRHTKASIKKMTAMLSTASPIVRWREANKEKIASGEVEDYVAQVARLTRETMAKVPGGEGVEELGFACSIVMIVLKKKASA